MDRFMDSLIKGAGAATGFVAILWLYNKLVPVQPTQGIVSVRL